MELCPLKTDHADSAPTNVLESLVNFPGTKICWWVLVPNIPNLPTSDQKHGPGGRESCNSNPLVVIATPWLTDAGGRRRIGGSVGRVERCRRSEAWRMHWFGGRMDKAAREEPCFNKY